MTLEVEEEEREVVPQAGCGEEELQYEHLHKCFLKCALMSPSLEVVGVVGVMRVVWVDELLVVEVMVGKVGRWKGEVTTTVCQTNWWLLLILDGFAEQLS